MKKISAGFTLLEMLIVIAIISLIGVAGSAFYVNFVRSTEIKGATDSLVSDLKLARSRAMAGENGVRWGVHMVNGPRDTYEVFASPTNYSDPAMFVYSSVFLSDGVAFSDPAEGLSKDIVFSGASGTTTATIINLVSSVKHATITVTAEGVVY